MMRFGVEIAVVHKWHKPHQEVYHGVNEHIA